MIPPAPPAHGIWYDGDLGEFFTHRSQGIEGEKCTEITKNASFLDVLTFDDLVVMLFLSLKSSNIEQVLKLVVCFFS